MIKDIPPLSAVKIAWMQVDRCEPGDEKTRLTAMAVRLEHQYNIKRLDELSVELYMEPYDCYTHGDNSHLTDELGIIGERMEILLGFSDQPLPMHIRDAERSELCLMEDPGNQYTNPTEYRTKPTLEGGL